MSWMWPPPPRPCGALQHRHPAQPPWRVLSLRPWPAPQHCREMKGLEHCRVGVNVKFSQVASACGVSPPPHLCRPRLRPPSLRPWPAPRHCEGGRFITLGVSCLSSCAAFGASTSQAAVFASAVASSRARSAALQSRKHSQHCEGIVIECPAQDASAVWSGHSLTFLWLHPRVDLQLLQVPLLRLWPASTRKRLGLDSGYVKEHLQSGFVASQRMATAVAKACFEAVATRPCALAGLCSICNRLLHLETLFLYDQNFIHLVRFLASVVSATACCASFAFADAAASARFSADSRPDTAAA